MVQGLVPHKRMEILEEDGNPMWKGTHDRKEQFWEVMAEAEKKMEAEEKHKLEETAGEI